MPLKPELSGELRNMVREILREAVAGRVVPELSAVETVRVTSDSDLRDFVQRLLDPATQERVKSGKLHFRLAADPGAIATAAGPLTGVVSEKMIDRHSGSSTLVIASDAVLTPLARDRARQLGMKIERDARC